MKVHEQETLIYSVKIIAKIIVIDILNIVNNQLLTILIQGVKKILPELKVQNNF